MHNVIAFTPRPRVPVPPVLPPLAGLALRTHLEEAAQTALDAADHILAALDRIEGAGEPEGSETAPAPTTQMVPPSEEAPIIVLPGPPPETPPQAEPEPEPVAAPEIHAAFPPLSWAGAGNVVSACGFAVLALVGMRA